MLSRINFKSIITLLLLIVSKSALSQQTCGAPTVISSLPYTLASGTTCGSVNNYTTTIGGNANYVTGEDLIFRFIPATSGLVTISVTQPSGGWLGMYLYTGCPFTAYISGVQNNTATKSFTANVTAGVTYFLMLDTYAAPSCTSFTNLTISAPVGPPTITSFTPTSGCPGSSITINGTNFTGATAANVKIGGTSVTSITSNTGTQIVAVIGAGTTGTVSVTTTPGTGTSSQTFTFSSAPTTPASPNTTNLQTTSFTANWTASTGGGISGYLLDVSTSSTFASFVTGFNGLSVGNVLTYNVTGLTANTTYYWRVRAVGSGCNSANSSTVSLYTGYCTPAPTSVDGTGITNVNFGIGPAVNNTTGAESGNYGNYSAQIGAVYQGNTIPVNVTFSTGYTYGTQIWVDWNNDLDFADAGELMYTGLSTSNNPTTLAASFLVPFTTPVGNYRMRIGGTDADAGPNDPCYASSYGTFEDYTLSVIALPSCSGTPVVGPATTWYPVALTGFNADVIANGIGAASSSASQFDTGGYGLVSSDFKAVSTNAAPTYALPITGIVNSAANPGIKYQMANYAANNSLRLTGTQSGTLTLGTGSSAKRISILTSSGNGASTFTAQVNFSDGTNQQFTGNTVTDWYGSNYAIAAIGRVLLSSGALEGTATQPGLYDVVLNISSANQSKTITSVIFTKTDANTSSLNVFGLSLNSNTPTSVVCNGQTRTLSIPDFNSNFSGYSYQWQTSSSATGPWSNISGATSTTYTTPALTTVGNVYYQCVVYCGLNAGTSSPVMITVNGTASLSPNTATICGNTLAALPSTNSTYLWSTAATTQSITIPSTGTYNVIVRNNECVTSLTTAITTINPLPSVTSTGVVNGVCTSTSSQTTTLAYTATTSSPISYSIDWDATANTAGLADVSLTPFGFVSTGGSITIPVAANLAPGTYLGVLTYANSSGCSSTISLSFTVTSIPTLGGVSQAAVLCYNPVNSSTVAINLTGLIASTPQVATYSINGGSSQTISFTSSSTGTASVSIPVTYANNGQTLTISSINCANFTTNNSVVLAINNSPAAPTVSASSTSINVGGSAAITGTIGTTGNTLSWYSVPTGGTAIALNNTPVDETQFNTANIPINFCTPNFTTTYYVQETDINNGCPSPRTAFTISTNPISTSSPSNLLICQSGGSVTITANVVPSSSTPIIWTSSTTGGAPWANITPSSNPSILTVSPTITTHYQLAAVTPMGCNNSITFPTFQVGVLNPLAFTPTANPSEICAGQNSVLSANLVSGNFSVSSTPYVAYVPTNATTVIANGSTQNGYTLGGSYDDGGVSGIPIGFNFNFFGSSFSQIAAGTNGLLMFGPVPGYTTTAGQLGQYSFNTNPTACPVPGANGTVFPNCNNPGNVIALMAGDQYFGGAPATMKFWNTGIAPTRKFYLLYENVAPCCTASSSGFTAYVILYETTGIVEIHIKEKLNTGANTVGLQDATKTIGACPPGRQAFTATITNSEAWRFTPGAAYTYQWLTAGQAIAGATSGTYTTPTLNNAGTVTYNVAATNPITSCATTQSVNITVNGIPNPPVAQNSTQCGPGVPTATVSSGNGVASPSFSWYTASPVNAAYLVPLSVYYSNDFSTSVGTGILSGDAVINTANGFVRLTNNNTSLLGGFTIPASGYSSDRYQMNFDIQAVQSGGADGISYSFADDADATATTPNAEHGTGSKLVISFDEYGTAGTNGSPGIRVIYGGAISDPSETVGGVVLAYVNNTSWSGATGFIPVQVDISQSGKLNLTVNGSLIVSNLQLPSAYLSADKSNWKHVFKARTGGVSANHRIDNVIIKQSSNTNYTSSVSQTTTFYVTESVNGCPSATATPVTVTVNAVPAAPVVTPNPVTSASSYVFCQGFAAPQLVGAALGSNTLTWLTNGANASSIAPTPATSVAGNFSYSVTQTDANNGCVSPATTIPVVVNATPAAPSYTSSYSSGTITQCQGTANISIGAAVTAAAGGTLNYYTVPTGGSALGSVPSSNGAVAGTTVYYVSQTILGCEGPRTAVTSVVNPSLTPAVAISASTTSTCPGTSIAFTAVPTNGGPAPTYQWYLNGVAVAGQTSASYTLASPVAADAVYVTMVSNEPSCLFTPNATSSTITLTNSAVSPSVSIIQSTGTTICAGTAVTFSVQSSVNMGATPTYAWKVNGTTVGTGATYTTTTLVNSDVVTLSMTSSLSASCLSGNATATSTGITMTVTPVTAITTQPANASVCLGGSQALTVSAVGTGTITYQWQSASTPTGTFSNISFASNSSAQSATLAVPTVTGQLSYQLVATSSCGSATSTVATISINQATVITTQPATQTVCEGSPVTFTVGALGTGTISYQWRYNGSPIAGATSSSYTIPTLAMSNAGVYSVVVTATCGSVTSSNATLTVNPLTAISVQPIGSTVCENSPVNLSVTASGTGTLSYQWSNSGTAVTGATSAIYTIPTAAVSQSGSYTVTVTGGCSNLTSAAATVVVNTNTLITTQPQSYTGCAFAPTTVAVSAVGTNLSYVWYNGTNVITGASNANYSMSNPQPVNSGNYTVTVSGTCGTETSNIALITINPLPSPGIIAGGASGVCVGSTITLTNNVTGGVWSSNNTSVATVNAATGVVSGISSGTVIITYTMTNAFGCVNTTTKTIQVKALPTAVILTPPATQFCIGESMTLQASSAFTYLWSNGTTTQNNTITTGGSYTVTVTGTNGCSATSAPLAISVIAAPTVAAIQGSANLCVGSSYNFTSATSNGLWTSSNPSVVNVNTTSGLVTAAGSGTATITYNVANVPGCLNTNPGSASTSVTVNTPPVAQITQGGATTFCQGGSVTLTANSGASYQWSNGATTQAITVSSSGSYHVTVTNASGCSATSLSVPVTVNPIPNATVYPSNAITICSGTTINISSGTAAAYAWSNGQTTASINVGTAGTYSVTLTGSNGCTATSAPIVVTVNQTPTATISSVGSTSICQGSSVALNASTGVGYSYAWNTGATTASISASSTGSYSVTVTANGCSATSSSTSVTLNPVPSSSITANGPVSFCDGGSVSLSAPSGNNYSYSWTNGATTQQISTSVSGSFGVTVTNAYGCSSTSVPTTVTVNPLPAQTPIIGASSICQNSSAILSHAFAGGIYATSNSAVLTVGQTSGMLTPVSTGTATITYTYSNVYGCTNSVQSLMTVNPSPTASISPQGATTFCQGGAVAINASTGGSSYAWSNGATTQNISATSSGQYSVMITNAYGCQSTSNAITVTVDPIPNATIYPGTSVNICSGSSVTLSTGSAAAYLWSNGQTTPTITVNAAGTYAVTLTGSNGCTASSAITTVSVTQVPTAAITASGPTTICQGSSVTLTASPATNYLWNNGATTQSITVSNVGSYYVNVGTGSCSATSAPVYVAYNPVPQATITASGPTTFCAGNNVTLSAPAGNSFTYLWSNGATSQSVSTAAAGTFSVTVTNAYGCSATSSSQTVVVNPLPIVTPITGTATLCSNGQSQLSNAMTGGIYSCSNLNVATIGNTSGLVSGIGAGTATITYVYTNLNGCSNSVTYPITVIAAPVATITSGGATSFCQGGSVTLTASAAASYLWSTGATTSSITASASGNYSVALTAANGCSATSLTTVVNQLAPPVVNATSGASTVCTNGITTLTNTTSNGLWSSSNTAIATVNASTGVVAGVAPGAVNIVYTVVGTNGCSATAVKPMSVITPTASTISASGSTTICQGASVTLTASTASSYLWSNGATTQSITVSQSGPYAVQTSVSGCTATSTNTVVTVVNPPVASITASGLTTLCAGSSVTLTAAPASSYSWTTGATTQSITVSAAGSYGVTVSSNGCSATSVPTVVSVNALPTASISAGGSTSFCAGGSVTLTAAPATSYLWSNGANTQSISVAAAGSYTVSVNTNGCAATSAPTVVTILPAPTAVITNTGSTTFCQGSSVVLNAPSAPTGSTYTYVWRLNGTPISGATAQTYTASTAGSYSLVVTNNQGCSATSVATTVSVNALPTASITPSGSTTICQGGAVTLTAPAAAAYVWSTGATTQSISVSAAGSYTVTVNANGCTATSSATAVTVNALPTASITASGATTICQGSSVVLTASPATTYAWSNGATTASITVNTAGNYTVAVSTNGCSATSAVTSVNVTALPTASISTIGSTTICQGSSVTLTASPASAYLWSNGQTTQSIVATQAANYTVTVSSNGCSALSAAVPVVVNAIPTATISANGPLTFCQGGSVTLTAAAAASYAWSTGATTQSITVNTSGNYGLTSSNAVGCSASAAPTVVTVQSLPTVPQIQVAGSLALCPGASVTLSAPAATAYAWTNGQNTPSISVSTPGQIGLTVTNAAGCSASAAPITITAISAPVASITASGSTTICSGSTVVLTASPASAYLWNNGQTSQSINVSAAGTYSVQTSANGCSSISAPTVVQVNALPSSVVSASGPLTFCQGGAVVLTAAPASSYLWSNGATTASISVTTSGNYDVQLNANGCSVQSAPTTVSVLALPSVTIAASGPTTFCSGASITLTADPAATYNWTTGAQTQSIQVSTSSTVGLTVSNGVCSATATPLNITVLPSTVLPAIAGANTVCAGTTSSFSNATSGGVWSSSNASLASIDAQTGLLTATNAGQVSVTYTYVNAAGCSSSVSTPVAISSIAPVSIAANGATSFCSGAAVQLSLPSGYSYQWTNSQTSPSIVVNASGSYGATITNAAGCTYQVSPVQVTVYAAPVISIQASSPAICSGQAVNLTASTAAASYSWSTGATTNAISVNQPGNYLLTIVDANGCSASTLYNLGTGITPSASISASGATNFCPGASVTLTANNYPNGTYTWSTGASTNAITATSAGTYFVTVTSPSGCSAVSNAITVTVLPQPSASISVSGATTSCSNQALSLAVSGTGNYTWTNGQTSQSIVPTTTGSYGVTVTGPNGCATVVTPVAITILPAPTAVITASGPLTFCQGGSVGLTASGAASYVWSTTQNTAQISATTSGNYVVTATAANGCVDTESIAVTVNALPANYLVASGSLTFCQGDEVVLTAAPGNTCLWSNGLPSNAITVTSSGTYSATLTSPAGCTVTTNAMTVQVNQASSSTLNVTGGNDYTLNGILYTQSGSYTQVTTNAAGCDSTITLNLTLTVGLSDQSLLELSVQPNPTDAVFTLTTSLPLYSQYVILDAQGKQVAVGNLTGNTTTIAIDQVARGVYFLKVEEASETIRVVKN
jgi:hypothetical protein